MIFWKDIKQFHPGTDDVFVPLQGDSCKSFQKYRRIWPCCSYDREGRAFRLCEVHGFGFLTVDQIAVKAKHFRADDPLRIKAAILHIMSEAEKAKDICI